MTDAGPFAAVLPPDTNELHTLRHDVARWLGRVGIAGEVPVSRMFRRSDGWLKRAHACSSLVGGQIRTARSAEGRKVMAQARAAAASPQGRRLVEKAKRVGKTAGRVATSSENRTRLDALHDRLRMPDADRPRAGRDDRSGGAAPQRDPRSPLSGE